MTYYRHPDWLGSSRLARLPARAKAAGGVDTLLDGFSRRFFPIEVLAANGFMAAATVGEAAGGVLTITGGCVDPTPGEPLTFAGGLAAGGIAFASAAITGTLTVRMFSSLTIPAFKNWGCGG